ncbi:hypothetical protein GCM10011385_17960 [Nitratireductor aestuarii]|uniref:N-acyl amino acid synthase FeeM catalytic core domain-containing protein n=1 Tax=Nitratireductor aestuarii TaxID=1735103 RepID=A0A916W3L4_9HYPH|nr:hypothetical protein [Nitratireductor aestuarii]GGA64601.1 hypothetical protein GCM10011385_17960 [Nitratireductor aestuarii]
MTPNTLTNRGTRAEESPFNRSVFSVLDHIEYRICDEGEDLEAVYRLRYQSYLAAGMIKEDAARQIHDKYDEMPNSHRFGVFYKGNLVSTIRVHHLSQEHPIAPSCGVFGDVIEARLKAGQTFVDPSRMAADLEWGRKLRVLPYITLRLAVLGAKYFRTDYSLIAIKEEHSAFYYRTFRAEPATGPRSYPGLEVPVHLLQMNTREVLDEVIERMPFFGSTEAEQRMLYGRKRSADETGSLSVHPTARLLLAAA